MNVKYTGIMVVIMLVISAVFFPTIQGSEVNSVLKLQNTNTKTEEDDFNSYLQQLHTQDHINTQAIFKEIQTYLSLEDDKGSLYFKHLCNRLEQDMGKETFQDFMSFLYITLKYLNTNDNQINEINTLFYERILSIKNDIYSKKNNMISIMDIFEKNLDVFKIFNLDDASLVNAGSAFEVYWTEYGKAKCYWDGYMPAPTGDNGYGPNKLRNVNRRGIGLWAGENFYDWHQNAIDYIIGLDDETGKATFVQLISLGLGTSAIMFVVSSIIWSLGFFTNNEDWILAGGLVAIIGLFCAGLTAIFLYQVLYYFLYGSNAYFEMQRYGNVDLIINVIDETGSAIPSYMAVTAQSADAVFKYEQGEPVYPGFTDVTWSSEEFTYELVRVIDQDGNPEVSTFCLHAAQESPEKWKKAVPPPGNWIIYIQANGYETKTEGYPIPVELSVGECYHMTIQLNKT